MMQILDPWCPVINMSQQPTQQVQAAPTPKAIEKSGRERVLFFNHEFARPGELNILKTCYLWLKLEHLIF